MSSIWSGIQVWLPISCATYYPSSNASSVAYTGTPVLEVLSSHPNLVVVHVAQPPKWIAKLPRILFILVAPFKLVFGALSLFWAVVVQLPTFPRALLVQVSLCFRYWAAHKLKKQY